MENYIKANRRSNSQTFLWYQHTELCLYQFYRTITACPITNTQTTNGLEMDFKKSARAWVFVMFIAVLSYLSITTYLRNLLFPTVDMFLTYWRIVINVGITFSTVVTILIETQFIMKFLIEFSIIKQKIENDLQSLCRREVFETERKSSLSVYIRILKSSLIFSLIIDIVCEKYYIRRKIWCLLPNFTEII